MTRWLLQTPIADLVLIACKGKIVYCNWHHSSCERKLSHIISLLSSNVCSREDKLADEETLNHAKLQLIDYFEGKLLSFNLPLEFYGTEFQKRVWNEIATIPYAQTISYKTLAERSGKPGASRAVASACGRNPISVIIPCHRVISAHASLGGYTGPATVKSRLLSLESEVALTDQMPRRNKHGGHI